MLRKQIVQSDTVVLLIDMQDFFIKRLRAGAKKLIVPNQRLVIKKCARLNIPVIIVEFYNCGETIRKIQRSLRGVYTYTIVKNDDNAFANPALDKLLKRIGAKKVVLMGINSTVCVMKTAESALKNGYQIITSKDVIANRSHHSKDNGANWYKENGLLFTNAASMVLSLSN